MAQPVRFPYMPAGTTEASLMPRLSLTLTHAQRTVEIVGLLDTGAAVNVLPYPVGVALGAETGTNRPRWSRWWAAWDASRHVRWSYWHGIRSSRSMARSASYSHGHRPKMRQ
jgi:hypothetical protein